MAKNVVSVLAFVVLIPIAACGDTLQNEIRKVGLQPVKAGTELIDFELESLDGEMIKLSSYKGKVVFLNFWATWCPPCVEEMPSMQKLYDRFKDQGLEMIAVDLQEDKAAVQKFFDKYELTFTAVIDKTGRIGSQYGARNIPTTYIIDRKGFVLAGTIGGKDWYTPEMIDFFETLLKN
jgi:peroxiredoxin